MDQRLYDLRFVRLNSSVIDKLIRMMLYHYKLVKFHELEEDYPKIIDKFKDHSTPKFEKVLSYKESPVEDQLKSLEEYIWRYVGLRLKKKIGPVAARLCFEVTPLDDPRIIAERYRLSQDVENYIKPSRFNYIYKSMMYKYIDKRHQYVINRKEEYIAWEAEQARMKLEGII